MARYNAWQNDGLREMIAGIDRDELYRDRGAFFGSIMGTLNHVLWGDAIWISRFDSGAGPAVPAKDHLKTTPTPAVWAAERFRMDARIRLWAQSVSAIDLVGDLTWHAALSGQSITKPLGLCIVQLFNHQTHHRGQVHAMLTAMGLKPNDTDLPFMPED
ncbi:DinB family protein [Roseobacter sp. CCS2]|uniref:DinB family protein n=1 Tax=Roseobacter sp. CCS2 TaxID=391593 RepID=UPI0000F3C4C0|nr:DinB family protein [Roseobacter sp. CCS2]